MRTVPTIISFGNWLILFVITPNIPFSFESVTNSTEVGMTTIRLTSGKAFQRIVSALQDANLTNFATVYASSSGATPQQFEQYDPGPEYYDWVGYSWWGGERDGQAALDFARKVGKPIFIAEATPRGHFFDREDPQQVWDTWFQQFFTHIEENKGVVRAVSYINANWEGQDMWKGEKWGQTRLETAPLLKSKWLEKMAEAQFVNAVDKPFDLIGFPNRKARSLDSGTYRDASLAVGKLSWRIYSDE